MRKIDKLVLDAFLGPFVITFLVVVFILLNIQMLKYFDDIIGKGLEWLVLGQLLFYFAIYTIPTAMPLAVLLSSLIAYGNLGEHFELTAIKGSGISLLRTLQPIFLFVLMLTGVAFYVNNTLVPKAALEAYSLLYDIKQKKPALDLREGTFYNGLPNISIKVDKKFPDGETLKNIIIYNHEGNNGNRDVTVADSGRMYTILEERYLKFELYNGYNYTEGTAVDRQSARGPQSKETLRRVRFDKNQVVYDLSSFNLQRTEKKWFESNRIMRNVSQLDTDIDSIQREIMDQRLSYYLNKPSQFAYAYRKSVITIPDEVKRYRAMRDSLNNVKYEQQRKAEETKRKSAKPKPAKESKAQDAVTENKIKEPVKKTEAKKPKPVKKKETNPSPARKTPESGLAKAAERRRQLQAQKEERKPGIPVELETDSAATDTLAAWHAKVAARYDSVFLAEPSREMITGAANTARQFKTLFSNGIAGIDNYVKERKIFEIQWHKILANSMACIAMFLIGAPLGAIIKRGGLGVPFLVSILFFIIFYILSMQGEKLVKQDTVDVPIGIWAADVILLVIGLFFLRQARNDARLFEADFYSVVIDKMKRYFKAKAKEVPEPHAA